MISEIENLPDVSFIDDVSLDDVQQQMVSDYKEEYKRLTGKESSLSRADPMALLLYACSVQIFQGFLFVDRAGKMDLLKYSYGEYLDNLAAGKGIAREPAKPAVVTVRFTLSGQRPGSVAIPAGTRVTNGETYFATDVYSEIPAGSLSADVLCTCQKRGKDGNGILAGDVNILVDPIPYMDSVSSTEATSGGSDIEDDESLTERIYLAPSRYSVAGPEEAYRYWILTFNSSISDVAVHSDSPSEVMIEIIMDNGELPTQSVIQALSNYLESGNVRPLTDHVTVKAPSTVNYNLNVKYFINKSDSARAATIQQQVSAAVEEYIVWQRSKIGRDINSSKLISLMESAGAKRVEITAPVYQKIDKGSVAKLVSKTVSYGGIEDD